MALRSAVLLLVAVAAAVPIVADDALEPEDIFARNQSAVFRVTATGTTFNGTKEPSGGTGFLIDSEGFAITANHVVFMNKNFYKDIDVSVSIGPKKQAVERSAKIVAVDVTHDMALLKVDGGPFTSAVELAPSSKVRVGARVTTMGFGKTYDLSIVEGLISNEARDDRWQTNALLNIGNSGAPVFDRFGKAIGVAWGGAFEEDGIRLDGVKYLVPVDAFRDTLFRTPVATGPKIANVPCAHCHADKGAVGSVIQPDPKERLILPLRLPPPSTVRHPDRFSRSFSIAEVRTGRVSKEFRADAGYEFVDATLAEISTRGVSNAATEFADDRQRVIVSLTIESDAAASPARGWYFGTLVTEQKRR